MSEDTTRIVHNDEDEAPQEEEKPFDYDDLYASDPNSGASPQPGGTVLPAEENKDIIVNEDGETEVVSGNDVTSKAFEEKLEKGIEAQNSGTTREQVEADQAKADAEANAPKTEEPKEAAAKEPAKTTAKAPAAKK